MPKRQPASSQRARRTAKKSGRSSVKTRKFKIAKTVWQSKPSDDQLAGMTNDQLAAAGYASATLKDLREHAKTTEFAASMKRLKATREEDIDYTEIPPISDARLAAMVRADQYRPVKRTVTIRFDADVLDWLKSKGSGYQTKLNAMLRGQMLREAEG